ncbi:MAG TPA: phosphoribosylglycinamide synthetase C domain-containing protein, partial [Candidatus Caenarcaniphilales bacterium]
KVIEFNCRFGDPETQAILPLLETPLESLLLACSEQRLAQAPPIRWQVGMAACVVTAVPGYPGAYAKGQVITGVDQAVGPNVAVFHAGTKLQGQQLVTDGGRVLGVTAWGTTFDQAIAQAYAAVDVIHYEGKYCRRDIGYRVRSASSALR